MTVRGRQDKDTSVANAVTVRVELQRRLTAGGSRVRSIIAHPAIATTTLARGTSSGRIYRLSWFLDDPEHGALSLM